MNFRYAISLLASVALFGCAENTVIVKEMATPLGMHWDRAAWRFCTAPDCANPTQKTVVIVTAPAAVEPLPMPPKKLPVAIKQTRTFSVPFQFSSTSVSKEAETLLRQEVAQWKSVDSIVVEGRTDDLGSQSFNDRLARNRADAVVSILKQLRITGEIAIHSQGKCCYATTNRSESSRARNRRVDLQISTTQKE